MKTMLVDNKTSFYMILCNLFCISLAFSAQLTPFVNPAEQIKPNWQDIPYAQLGEREKLDIYLPDQSEGPFPVLIYIHGGAWMGGSKTPGSALAGLKRGYAVVAAGYTLSQEAKYPRQIYEIKAAIRWMRANAKLYKLNPDRIAVWGDSAGGHLASLAGTTGDVNDLEDLSMGNPVQSSRVQAVVDWYGPTDFLKMDQQFEENQVANPMRHSIEDSPESLLLGAMITEVPEKVKAANPETYITADDPPFFIQHGKVDNLVPYQQSEIFAAKLTESMGKEKVTLELLESAGHGGFEFRTTENLDKVFKFLDRYLKDDDPNEIVAKHIIFTGRVQGVGFRNKTRLIARRYPITGFVKNLEDGTVEFLAQGPAKDVENCIHDIREFFADNIKDTRIEETPYDKEYTDFQITY